MKFHETKGLAKFSKERNTGKKSKQTGLFAQRCYFCKQLPPKHDWKCPTLENRYLDTV